MASPLLTVLTECYAALADVAPSFEGTSWLDGAHDPPRYVWIVNGASSRGASAIGGNPRSLGDDLWDVEVHCWGTDLDHAILLRAGLVTAVRQVVKGKNYGLGTTRAIADSVTAKGRVVVVPMTLITQLPEVVIPTLVNDLKLTHRPTTVDIDPGTPVTGDRNLDAPNEPAP